MNYKQSNITGTTYTRFPQINISNPLNQTPQIQVYTEEVVVLDTPLFRNQDMKQYGFEPDEVIDVINPDTLEPTGSTITGSELYALLYSYCMKKANEPEPVIEEEVYPED